MPNYLAITIGLPRSGKKTLARAYRIENPDVVIVDPCDTRYSVINGIVVEWDTVQELVTHLLKKGKSVLVLDTHCTISSRRRWVALAQDLTVHPLGIIWMITSKEECLQRNNTEKYLHQVEVTRNRIISLSEIFEPPSEAEGLVMKTACKDGYFTEVMDDEKQTEDTSESTTIRLSRCTRSTPSPSNHGYTGLCKHSV